VDPRLKTRGINHRQIPYWQREDKMDERSSNQKTVDARLQGQERRITRRIVDFLWKSASLEQKLAIGEFLGLDKKHIDAGKV
jgi:hypothetical protein